MIKKNLNILELFMVDKFYFQECLNFLKEMPFDASNDVSANPFQYSGAAVNVYPETSSTFFKVLLL